MAEWSWHELVASCALTCDWLLHFIHFTILWAGQLLQSAEHSEIPVQRHCTLGTTLFVQAWSFQVDGSFCVLEAGGSPLPQGEGVNVVGIVMLM